MTDRLKIGQEVLIHGYVDEIRYDHTKRVSTVIICNEGGYFGTVEWEVTDIEMPDTNEVLDKIRAEIETKYGQYDICEYFEDYDYEENDISEYRLIGDIADILQIIDKYRKEQE